MIETERLHLRRWRNEDLRPFAKMNADPRVRRFFPSLLSTDESDASVARYQEMHALDGFCFFAAELRETSAFIGFVGMQRMSFQLPAFSQPAVEIGWRLKSEVWGRGLATEGARAVLAFAFTKSQLPEMVAITVPANVPSRRVMEKLGMSYNPTDDFDHPGVAAGHPFQRHILYRIQREAWRNQQ